jgi:PqqD family protein of HPr-rel-A system
MTDKPARADGIEINPVADGYVVYDPYAERVHYLNHTAAVILELCNSDNTVADIVRLVTTAFGLAEPPETEVQQCLAQLRDEGLIH